MSESKKPESHWCLTFWWFQIQNLLLMFKADDKIFCDKLCPVMVKKKANIKLNRVYRKIICLIYHFNCCVAWIKELRLWFAFHKIYSQITKVVPSTQTFTKLISLKYFHTCWGIFWTLMHWWSSFMILLLKLYIIRWNTKASWLRFKVEDVTVLEV